MFHDINDGKFCWSVAGVLHSPPQFGLESLVEQLKASVLSPKGKNVQILHISSQICRRMKGL